MIFIDPISGLPRDNRHWKGGSAPAPDPAVGQAAAANVELGREALAFQREQYADEKARLDALMPTIDRFLAGQIDSNQLQIDLAKQSAEDYRTTFRPIEQQFAAEAAAAGTPGEQEAAAGRAGIDVQRSLDTMREATAQEMAQMGINPGSGKWAGQNRTQEILGAAARAGAETGAREAERNRGIALRTNAVSVGRGLPATAIAASSGASGSAATGTNIGTTPINVMGNIGGQMLAGYGTAIGANRSAADILNSQFDMQTRQWSANQANRSAGFGAVGSAIGTGAALYMF